MGNLELIQSGERKERREAARQVGKPGLPTKGISPLQYLSSVCLILLAINDRPIIASLYTHISVGNEMCTSLPGQ